VADSGWLDNEELICCYVLSVSAETVCSYHSAGVTYGQPRLVNSCIDWLEKTLLPLQSAQLLQNVRLLFSRVRLFVHCV